MLDAYIIEWLKKLEQEKIEEEERPFLEIPLEEYPLVEPIEEENNYELFILR